MLMQERRKSAQRIEELLESFANYIANDRSLFFVFKIFRFSFIRFLKIVFMYILISQFDRVNKES